jgi:hypothetical protein
MHRRNSLASLVLALSLVGISCGRGNEEKQAQYTVADTSSLPLVASTAAVENTKDTTHRFIRTAEIKCKVKNVVAATYAIEDITSRQGGFVTNTELTSEKNNSTSIPISADSTLETNFYTVTNSITIRVPNTRLDNTLKEIAQHIEYLDYRTIKTEDVALQLLGNKLTQQRLAKTEDRLTNAIDNKGKKLTEISTAEDGLQNKQQQADEAQIANLALNDKINFSTIQLYLYQRETFSREVVANHQNITAYEPSFFSKIKESLQYGWLIIQAVFIFLLRFWAIVAVAFIVYLVYTKFLSKKSSK